MVQKIIFNLVPMVEKSIAAEMKESGCGAIMHDGWSKFGTHYVGLFAQYNRKIYQNIGKTVATTIMPTNVLLSMRPMSGLSGEDDNNNNDNNDNDDDDDDDDDDDEVEGVLEEIDDSATNFTAEVHAHYFKEVLETFGVDIEKWVLCQVRFQLLHYIIADSYHFPLYCTGCR